MIYLALGADGNMYNLGDCGDFDAADEIAQEYLVVESIWITGLDKWLEIAKSIERMNKKWEN